MKSEYFILLLNDFCCSLQRFGSHRFKNEKVMTETLSQLNAPVMINDGLLGESILSDILYASLIILLLWSLLMFLQIT